MGRSGKRLVLPRNGLQFRRIGAPQPPVARQVGFDCKCGGNACHGYSAFDNLFCHLTAADTPGDHQRHRGNFRNIAGEIEKIGLARQCPLIAGGSHHGGRLVAAAGKLHQIDTERRQHHDHGAGIFRRKAAALEISRIKLHGNAKARRNRRANAAHDIDKQARAVFEAAAPAVLSPV